MVVINTEDRGFESRQGVQFLGVNTVVYIRKNCNAVLRIVFVSLSEINVKKIFPKKQ
jgi:hypothetical protein